MRASEYLNGLLQEIVSEKGWPWPGKAQIEPPRDPKHGDLACNLAMVLAGELKRPPREIAVEVQKALVQKASDVSSEIAGPGFLNVTFAPAFWQQTFVDILGRKDRYGAVNVGRGTKVMVEYVSANPTGPLHLGHGRGAAVGDSLLKILRFAGYEAMGEYYLNDAGRQMHMLGVSVLLRARQAAGEEIEFPVEGHYQGEYIKDIARELLASEGPGILSLPEDEAVSRCRGFAMGQVVAGIRKDLEAFGVEHSSWFSERSLVESGAVEETLTWLQERGLADIEDGALWCRTTKFGDDKDRVLRKSDGELTYFASDIAYHLNKYQRGFDLLIDVWGADHHGYIPRMKAAVEALGRDRESFQVVLVQLVNLLKAGVPVTMSKRAGKFETLADILAEVGGDAASFIYRSRKSDRRRDCVLELVEQQTMENPVYYVQYAHARICSVRRKAEERNLPPAEFQERLLSLLDTSEDLTLARFLDRFPDTVSLAAQQFSPHILSHYLMELAGLLHRYYTTHPVLGAESEDLVQARRLLLEAVAQVLGTGLRLLGVKAPESM